MFSLLHSYEEFSTHLKGSRVVMCRMSWAGLLWPIIVDATILRIMYWVAVILLVI